MGISWLKRRFSHRGQNKEVVNPLGALLPWLETLTLCSHILVDVHIALCLKSDYFFVFTQKVTILDDFLWSFTILHNRSPRLTPKMTKPTTICIENKKT